MRAMTWVEMGLADITRHIVGCHLTAETRGQNAFDDVASNIYPALPSTAAFCHQYVAAQVEIESNV